MRGAIPLPLLRENGIGVVNTIIEAVRADVRDIERFYSCSFSISRTRRLQEYFQSKLDELKAINYDRLEIQDRTDFLLLQKYLQRQLHGLKSFENSFKELGPIIEPFSSDLVELLERRQKVIPTTGRYAAEILSSSCTRMQEKHRQIVNRKLRLGEQGGRFAAYRAGNVLDELRKLLREWLSFYKGYDPTFTWWTTAPCEEALNGLQKLAQTIRDELVGTAKDDASDIVGQPVGREDLLADLDAEFIAYTPEELISLAENEYAWCENEMIKASKAMGHEDNWKVALEYVKNMYVEPGQQTYLVHELSEEAITYVKKHDMVTVPPIAEECWKTLMMSPERQRVNPFFLGGKNRELAARTHIKGCW